MHECAIGCRSAFAEIQGFPTLPSVFAHSCIQVDCSLSDKRGWNALHFAIHGGGEEILLSLLQIPKSAPNPLAVTDSGDTLLHLLAKRPFSKLLDNVLMNLIK
jgi:ankyrin repeat protein